MDKKTIITRDDVTIGIRTDGAMWRYFATAKGRSDSYCDITAAADADAKVRAYLTSRGATDCLFGSNLVIALFAGEAETLVAAYNDHINNKNANLPLLAELRSAIADLAALTEAYDDWMAECMADGVFDRSLDLDAARAEVAMLKAASPRAAQYIEWDRKDPSSAMGFAASQAAKALAGGASLESAQAIANNWQRND